MKMAVEWHREAATIELQRFTGNGQLGGKKNRWNMLKDHFLYLRVRLEVEIHMK